jgi:hypothetical protein
MRSIRRFGQLEQGGAGVTGGSGTGGGTTGGSTGGGTGFNVTGTIGPSLDRPPVDETVIGSSGAGTGTRIPKNLRIFKKMPLGDTIRAH